MTKGRSYYNTLAETLGISKGQVISIIGSGGKSTLMEGLALALCDRLKIMVTTTTKIFQPKDPSFHLEIEAWDVFLSKANNQWTEPGSISVYGASAMPCQDIHGQDQIKISGIDQSIFDRDIEAVNSVFDLVLIEADGSRNRPFKGWKPDEPLIPENTTMTIGVLGAHQLGVPLEETYVHRMDYFKDFIQEGDTVITKETLLNVVTSDKGLFAKARGEKVLYLSGGSDDLCTWFKEKLNGGSIKIIS